MTRIFTASVVLAFSLSAPPCLADVKIGVGAPLSGGAAVFGAQIRMGAEQAVEDANAAGGLDGQKATLLVEDDGSDAHQGAAAARKFVEQGAQIVIGHFNSSVSAAAAAVYSDNGVLQITPASQAPSLTDPDPKTGAVRWNMFRTCGREDRQAAVAASYLLESKKKDKIAIVYETTPYGSGLAAHLKKRLNEAGVQETLFEALAGDEKEHSALVAKIKASGAAIVYYGGEYPKAALLTRRMRAQGAAAVMMGGDSLADEEYGRIAGAAVEGALTTFPPDPRAERAAADLLKRFEAKNLHAEAYAFYAYAAVQVLRQAAQAAHSVDPKDLARVMRSGMAFHTVLGEMSYDAKGDPQRPDYVLYQWVKSADGKYGYRRLVN